MDKNKNNSTLIKAVALCNKPSVHLVICGDGEERENLSNLAKELGIESQIHFLGNRSDMKELYAMADIFVMASYREGLSRSVMEAMASGLPCVVSEIRGNRDLIDNGKGGYLIQSSDTEGFACKICKLCITHNKTMGNYNRRHVLDFSQSNVIDRLNEVYERIFN